MADRQSELSKPTRHPQEVKGYIQKGVPEQLAREVVVKDILIHRLRDEKKGAVENSLTDKLTGLPNRRYLDEAQERMFAETKRMNHGITALFIDADNFKQVNSNHGEPVGDQVLIKLAQVLRSTLREADFLARYGGEEFVALLPESHSLSPEQLENLYQRLNDAVEDAEFPNGIHQTVSIGIASYLSGDGQNGELDSASELIRRANDAEHQAKLLGKNRRVVWNDSVPRVTKIKGA